MPNSLTLPERAKAVGLPEDATEEQIVAAENKTVPVFVHEQELKELATQTPPIQYNQLPRSIQGHIMNFNILKDKLSAITDENLRNAEINRLRKKSIIIADDIQTFLEKDLPDEEIPNPNNMLAERAKAVGLPEDATEEQIAAAEKAAADKAVEEEKKTALSARAKAAGLAEDATEEQIDAAEKAKNTPPPDPNEEDEATKAQKAAKAAEDARKAKEAADKTNPPKKFDIMSAFDL